MLHIGRTCAVLLLALFLAMLLLPPHALPPAHASAPRDSLLIFTAALDVDAFDLERGGIFVMRGDGTDVRQLTRFQTLSYDFEPHGLNLPDDHPAFSPDGKKVIFTSNREDPDNWELYVMDVNGNNVQRLTTSAGLDTEPVFSPDGSKIAFVSERLGNLDLFVMDVNGSNVQALTPNSSQEEIEPAWSPDGTQIAFGRVISDGEKDVFVMNANVTNLRRLTTVAGEDHDPTFSPTGTELVITSERAGTNPFGDVFKIRVSDGASLGNLTANLNHGGGDPAWSPDGTMVAFFRSGTSFMLPPMQLWVMDSDGTDYRQMANQGLLNIHPNWGRIADSDQDGRPDYMENRNVSFGQRDIPGPDNVTVNSPGDQMGAATALADLTHDTFPDLLVGIPGEDISGLADAGRVGMMLGSPVGPHYSGAALLTYPLNMDATTAGGSRQSNGRFGQTMVACDFNGDGFKDIAIGAPGQNRVFITVNIVNGWQSISASGLFGAALAAGDFNEDGRCDLAVGSPQEARTVGGSPVASAGGVRIYSGSAGGVNPTPQNIDQGSLPLVTEAGREEAGDQFGFALAAGDLNGDGADELVIGVPGENWTGTAGNNDGGLVHIIPGATALPLQLNDALARDGRTLPAPYTGLQSGSLFGEVLAMGDFNNDLFSATDLVVGVPHQNVGSVTDAGLVAVFAGQGAFGSGLLSATASAFTTAQVGGPATLTTSHFGATLAVGDLSGDSVADLVASAPRQAVGAASEGGQLYLVFGSRASTCSFCSPALAFSGGGLVPASAQKITQSQVEGAPENLDHFGGSLLMVPSANTLSTGDLDRDGQDDLLIGTPEEDVSTSTNSGLVSLRYGIKVGESVLTPTVGMSQVGEQVTFTLLWTHPERWRALESLHLRLRGPEGIVFWVRFDEATNTFHLFDPATGAFTAGAAPGSAESVENPTAFLDLAQSAATGSGAEGRDVTLIFALRFKEPAAGSAYTVELMATDDSGNSQGFDAAGTWSVGPFRLHVPLATADAGQP